MNPFDNFENIYCINLDRRTDRWERVRKEFESVGILDRVNRFSAIESFDGRVGLIKSFLALFKLAKEKNMKNILIFEDDVRFINNTLENLSLAIEQAKNIEWSMFYLGASVIRKLDKIDTNLCILKKSMCAHAVVYNENIYDKIINKFEKVNKIEYASDINDVYFSILQEKHTTLIVNPIIATQFPSYSDLEKKEVDYSYIEEKFKEFIK